MMPDSWVNVLLGEIVDHVKGFAFSSDNYSDSGTRIIRISDTSGASIRADSSIHYSGDNFQELQKYTLKEKDIIVNTVGSRPHLRDSMVGRVIRIEKRFCGSLLNQNMVKLSSNQKSDADFLYYAISNDRFLDFVTRIVRGNANQVSITLKDLFSFPILLPPILEQRRIAKILSTWDQAIEATEKLIASSEAQKKALMQQLLTGKKRLPGFDGEWTKTTLGDLGTVSSAGVDKKIIDGEQPVRLLNFLDAYRRELVFNDELEHEVTATVSKVRQCNVKKGDVFFTPTSETRDDIGLCVVAAEDMPGVVYSYHVVRLRPKTELNLSFSAYLFQTDSFKRQTYRMGDGSGQRYVISQSNFRKMEIETPPLPEQQAIGEILVRCSNQITKLQNDLERLKREKSALMQQLLTGKRRVAINQEEAA